IAAANRDRSAEDAALLLVDGVHGLGVEDETVAGTGCDFFVAGTHKWIFGPRGTGIVWGRPQAWAAVQPTVPAFEMPPFEAWLDGRSAGPTRAAWMSPGGFHAYEHLWALPAAFAFHARIGRARVAGRIHELNAQLKDGLSGMRHVRVLTPRDPALSAGLVAFELAGRTGEDVVKELHRRKVVASTSPYKPSLPRLAGSLLNTPAEVEQALRAVRALAA
ncbi:MAG TPA: aminotransferase class V-fold PLP-dependent enzyme, partial [Vicinamibacteria bacterium]|nr:aminotransferase class V-fold PLP-dependent enzyme [Vicinamibacteria bacterium]